MQIFIDDPTVGLKIDGVVSELYPELTKEQVKEVAHHVFHQVDINPVYDQARELIKKYVNDKEFSSIGESSTTWKS